MADRIPGVAPYEACLACVRGDTTTAALLEGEPEWCVAALSHLAGIPLDQAQATVLAYAENECGCAPGKVPAARITFGFRLCRECASSTGAYIFELGSPATAYSQPLRSEQEDA